ncbi:MAG: molybdopterin-binding protein, partial [Clostridia bacterium]|nr:molybdopterin-binding protein [Clostridia bacterium]
AFAPVITEKMESFGSEIMEVIYVPDDPDMIRDSIIALRDKGADMIFATGGMSVDPDDYTPSAIRATGAEVVKYGAPALPGAMFMMAYLGDVPVLGVPGAGMFYRKTVVDLLLPRILAGEKIERKDIVSLGVGGLL